VSDKTERGLFESTMVRLALALLALAAVLIIVGVIYFLINRANRNKPLEVDSYPGATQVSSEVLSEGFDHQQYKSADPIEKIEQFFRGQEMECTPQYRTVIEQPGQPPVKEGHLYTTCVLDRSGWGVTQYTKVQIDDGGNPTGQIIIDVQRQWGE